MDIGRVRSELRLALGAVYRIRMGTPYGRWTPEQVEAILRAKHDLTYLLDSLKEGWTTPIELPATMDEIIQRQHGTDEDPEGMFA